MANNSINVFIPPKQKRMMNHNQDPYSDEIYHLPIVITERDIQMEHIYSEFYNEEYWKEYDKKKKKRLGIDYIK